MAATNELQDAPAATARLSERDAVVLDELARSEDALLAFQGLRRRLGLHQQALARSLRRLERDGLVERGDRGYRVREDAAPHLPQRAPRDETPKLSLAKALLPPGVGHDAVVRHLAHRWFRGLRWYGLAQAPGETKLEWTLEPGDRHVRVRIAAGLFLIEADPDPSDPNRPFEAARGLLSALAELYGLLPTQEPAGAAELHFGPGHAA